MARKHYTKCKRIVITQLLFKKYLKELVHVVQWLRDMPKKSIVSRPS